MNIEPLKMMLTQPALLLGQVVPDSWGLTAKALPAVVLKNFGLWNRAKVSLPKDLKQ